MQAFSRKIPHKSHVATRSSHRERHVWYAVSHYRKSVFCDCFAHRSPIFFVHPFGIRPRFSLAEKIRTIPASSACAGSYSHTLPALRTPHNNKNGRYRRLQLRRRRPRQGGRAQDLLPPRRASRYVRARDPSPMKPTLSSHVANATRKSGDARDTSRARCLGLRERLEIAD